MQFLSENAVDELENYKALYWDILIFQNVGLFRDILKSYAFATFGFIVHSFSLGGTFLRLGFFSLYIRFRSGALVSGLDFLACLRGH